MNDPCHTEKALRPKCTECEARAMQRVLWLRASSPQDKEHYGSVTLCRANSSCKGEHDGSREENLKGVLAVILKEWGAPKGHTGRKEEGETHDIGNYGCHAPLGGEII